MKVKTRSAIPIDKIKIYFASAVSSLVVEGGFFAFGYPGFEYGDDEYDTFYGPLSRPRVFFLFVPQRYEICVSVHANLFPNDDGQVT